MGAMKAFYTPIIVVLIALTYQDAYSNGISEDEEARTLIMNLRQRIANRIHSNVCDNGLFLPENYSKKVMSKIEITADDNARKALADLRARLLALVDACTNFLGNEAITYNFLDSFPAIKGGIIHRDPQSKKPVDNELRTGLVDFRNKLYIVEWAINWKIQEAQTVNLNGNLKFEYKGGAKYEGYFNNGRMHGKGSYTLENGDKYVGEFNDGKPLGQGVFLSISGKKYIGEMNNFDLNGWGIVYNANGGIESSGIYKYGLLVNSQYVDPNSFTRIALGNTTKDTSDNQRSNNPITLDVAKLKCEELGFKPETEGFGKCVLQLSK